MDRLAVNKQSVPISITTCCGYKEALSYSASMVSIIVEVFLICAFNEMGNTPNISVTIPVSFGKSFVFNL